MVKKTGSTGRLLGSAEGPLEAPESEFSRHGLFFFFPPATLSCLLTGTGGV